MSRRWRQKGRQVRHNYSYIYRKFYLLLFHNLPFGPVGWYSLCCETLHSHPTTQNAQSKPWLLSNLLYPFTQCAEKFGSCFFSVSCYRCWCTTPISSGSLRFHILTKREELYLLFTFMGHMFPHFALTNRLIVWVYHEEPCDCSLSHSSKDLCIYAFSSGATARAVRQRGKSPKKGSWFWLSANPKFTHSLHYTFQP